MNTKDASHLRYMIYLMTQNEEPHLEYIKFFTNEILIPLRKDRNKKTSLIRFLCGLIENMETGCSLETSLHKLMKSSNSYNNSAADIVLYSLSHNNGINNKTRCGKCGAKLQNPGPCSVCNDKPFGGD